MNFLQFAKDHSKDGEIVSWAGDRLHVPRLKGDPEALLRIMLANADSTGVKYGNQTVHSCTADACPVLSKRHTFAWHDCVQSNIAETIGHALCLVPHADLIVYGNMKPDYEFINGLELICVSELEQYNGQPFFLVMDTERAGIHYKDYGETGFELCIFDWHWIAGKVG